MRADIKFCGLTRRADAELGASLGARFLGVVFAESPRRVTVGQALEVFTSIRSGANAARRVGVFGAASPKDIVATAREARLDVVQLHCDPDTADVRALRDRFEGEIWAARRIAGDKLPDDFEQLAELADRVLLDARPANGAQLGGTGQRFAWEAIAEQLRRRDVRRLVVAGGLTPDNVGLAIQLFAPDVVDVSSGVESSPGIKDHGRMQAFARAVGAAGR